jgi:hypothetical protein
VGQKRSEKYLSNSRLSFCSYNSAEYLSENFPMQETDARSLRAVLAAIAASPNALAPEMIRELNRSAIELREKPATAIDQLRKLMEVEGLEALYEEARQSLLAGYQSQPRGKEIKVPLGRSPQAGENELENLAVPLDQIALAQEILAAMDPRERAREVQANIEEQLAKDDPNSSSRQFWLWASYLLR